MRRIAKRVTAAEDAKWVENAEGEERAERYKASPQSVRDEEIIKGTIALFASTYEGVTDMRKFDELRSEVVSRRNMCSKEGQVIFDSVIHEPLALLKDLIR